MNHVGILRTGNEIDFIEELMSYHVQHFDTIYFLDDSTDGTGAVVRSFPEVIWSKTIADLITETKSDPKEANFEWVRQPVIERIMTEWGEGCWMTLLHGDELPIHCVQQMVERADYMGWNATVWNPLHAFLHSSQKDNWETEWAQKPVLERLRFYCPGDSQIGWAGAEVKQVKLSPDMFYTHGERYRYWPHLPDDTLYVTNPAPYPLYWHLGYRSPEQAMARVRHNAESAFQPVHRGLLDNGPFLDCLDGLSEVCEFQGGFGSREIPDFYSYGECPHKREA